MKIGFITYDIFTVGGIQRVVSVIANKLSEYYDVEIICGNENCKVNRNLYNLNEKISIKINTGELSKTIGERLVIKFIKELNKRVNIFRNKKTIDKVADFFFGKDLQEKYIKYINEQKYDIVIGVAGDYSLLLGKIADRINSKTIGWQHNSYDAYLNNKNRYHWNQDELFNHYIPKLDRYLVLTEYDQKMFLTKNNINSIVMYNPRSFDSSEKSKLISKNFLAAGRFNYQKGFDLLIKSFFEFSQKNHDWNLTIVGDGPEKKKIVDLINHYNLSDRIYLKGFTDNIKEYFLNCSSLLLPSRWEGMPMIVLESLEMGVTIISYNITAVESILKNMREGIIVKRYNTSDFAEAMYKMSESYEFRKGLSKNINVTSEKFSIEVIIQRWIDLLQNI